MGERALALCERSGDQYDLFYSQWAGGNELLVPVLNSDGAGPAILARADWERRGCVSLDEVIEQLDYLSTAAVYEVSVHGVRVRLPAWLGLDSLAHDGEPFPPGFGALLPVRDVVRAVRVRLGTRWLREAAARAVEAGVLRVPAAIKLLLLFLLVPSGSVPTLVRRFLDDGSLPGYAGD